MSKRREGLDAPLAPTGNGAGQLLTVRDLVQRLRLSRWTIHKMVRESRLPAPIYVTPARIRWRESEIAAWVAER
jgi:predicted DNA-binding transcriptional regulator AlpA